MASEPVNIEAVIRDDGRYPPEAFAFLNEGIARAAKDVYGRIDDEGPHHVSGQQLCVALRDFAIDRWGALAMTVRRHWNVHETIDFGNMVYLMIEHDCMSKSDEDRLDDFRDVYRFADAFSRRAEYSIADA